MNSPIPLGNQPYDGRLEFVKAVNRLLDAAGEVRVLRDNLLRQSPAERAPRGRWAVMEVCMSVSDQYRQLPLFSPPRRQRARLVRMAVRQGSEVPSSFFLPFPGTPEYAELMVLDRHFLARRRA